MAHSLELDELSVRIARRIKTVRAEGGRVTLHGGRVEVGNAETGGAEFRVALPGSLAG